MFSMKRSGFLRSFSGAVAPPVLLKRRFDEADKQRVRPVRAAFKLRMILHAHIKRPITQLHGLHRMSRPATCRRALWADALISLPHDV